MGLQSLLFSSDEKIVRVLRRVLNDLEIAVEHCDDHESAIRKLTRRRFEAVIVDATQPKAASLVLKSARSAPCNRRAVAVAIVEAQTGLRTAFDLGAHFVLYKPLSSERAKASFRAARALMKRERRRSLRVPVEIPVTIRVNDGAGLERAVTTDVGEGGIAVKFAQRPHNLTAVSVHFALPGTAHSVESIGQVSWENATRQAGIRFIDLSRETAEHLKAWLEKHSPEFEKDDPPVACTLTDLSLGGCYLHLSSPFPARTRVTISMRIGALEVQVNGIVRVMHPEIGMGVEFLQKTSQECERVAKFMETLSRRGSDVPELTVEPEGLEGTEVMRPSGLVDDPLLELFRKGADLAPENFHFHLSRQRGSQSRAGQSTMKPETFA